MKKYPTHVMSMTGTSPSHQMNTTNGMSADYKVTPPQSSTISTSTPWASHRGGSPSENSNLEQPTDQPSPADSPHDDFKDMMVGLQVDPFYFMESMVDLQFAFFEFKDLMAGLHLALVVFKDMLEGL